MMKHGPWSVTFVICQPKGVSVLREFSKRQQGNTSMDPNLKVSKLTPLTITMVRLNIIIHSNFSNLHIGAAEAADSWLEGI